MRRVAALLGALAVLFGAFGAHALRDLVEPARLETWRTAVSYQFWHVLAIWWATQAENVWAARSFLAGIILFSGSLYALVLADLPILGAITPLGGVCFIAGWLLLALDIGGPKES